MPTRARPCRGTLLGDDPRIQVTEAGHKWATLIFAMALALMVREATPWRFTSLLGVKKDSSPTGMDEETHFNLSFITGESAGEQWRSVFVDKTKDDTDEKRSPWTPVSWDSSGCMDSHELPELQKGADPGGYLVFSEGREQLGNNRILISDGLVIAKTLGRTLVEFPMLNSRIASPDAERGLCNYWDCDSLCKYHRILDLWTFRSLLGGGAIDVSGFLQIESAEWEQGLLPSLVTAENIIDYFENYRDAQVIVMKMAWKSGLLREPLNYLTPNPFYKEVVQDVMSRQKGWDNGQFIAVQWRTETSQGNLTQCYDRYIKPAVEQYRLQLELEKSQVFFNVDLLPDTSTTYNWSVVQSNRGVLEMIKADYPSALDNTVHDLLRDEQDAGVRAMITGLVSASSKLLLSSSFNSSGSSECQKPHSKYIDLVAEWRRDVFDMADPDSIVNLFPESEEGSERGLSWFSATMVVALLYVFVVFAGRVERTVQAHRRVRLSHTDAVTPSAALMISQGMSPKAHVL